MAQAMRTMFTRLGFVDPGPNMIVVDQGIDHIDVLADLDNEEIETLLKLLRHPWGVIANPNAADPGQRPSLMPQAFQSACALPRT